MGPLGENRPPETNRANLVTNPIGQTPNSQHSIPPDRPSSPRGPEQAKKYSRRAVLSTFGGGALAGTIFGVVLADYVAPVIRGYRSPPFQNEPDGAVPEQQEPIVNETAERRNRAISELIQTSRTFEMPPTTETDPQIIAESMGPFFDAAYMAVVDIHLLNPHLKPDGNRYLTPEDRVLTAQEEDFAALAVTELEQRFSQLASHDRFAAIFTETIMYFAIMDRRNGYMDEESNAVRRFTAVTTYARRGDSMITLRPQAGVAAGLELRTCLTDFRYMNNGAPIIAGGYMQTHTMDTRFGSQEWTTERDANGGYSVIKRDHWQLDTMLHAAQTQDGRFLDAWRLSWHDRRTLEPNSSDLQQPLA